MRKFSDGSDATLETLERWASLFGPKPEAFIANRIATSPNGKDEEIVADESQILVLFASMMGDGQGLVTGSAISMVAPRPSR